MSLASAPSTITVRDLGVPVKAVNWVRLHPGRGPDGKASLLASMGQNNGGLFVLDIDLETGRCKQFNAASALQPCALNRTVQVQAVDHLADAVPLLAVQRDYLQTVGVAAAPRELHALAETLGHAGATRICALGQMTAPEAGWHHDGRAERPATECRRHGTEYFYCC